MRSVRLYSRPDRRLYSGNIPATPTIGSDRSRCPAFKWQLLQVILLCVNWAASAGVFVKMRKPQRMSADNRESSSVRSDSGLRGTSHAVTIVVADGINGPARGTPEDVLSEASREQPAIPSSATSLPSQARPLVGIHRSQNWPRETWAHSLAPLHAPGCRRRRLSCCSGRLGLATAMPRT